MLSLVWSADRQMGKLLGKQSRSPVRHVGDGRTGRLIGKWDIQREDERETGGLGTRKGGINSCIS